MAEKYDLFLSYARGDDKPFVRRLYHDLSALCFKVWWDRECMPSRALTFLQENRDAIQASDRLPTDIGLRASQTDSSCLNLTKPTCPEVLNSGWRLYEPSAPFPLSGQ